MLTTQPRRFHRWVRAVRHHDPIPATWTVLASNPAYESFNRHMPHTQWRNVPMMPVQELLHRIQWDPDFGNGDFRIRYFDRLEQAVKLVPLSRLHFDPGDKYSFELADEEGTPHTIPLHRVREVYRNGYLIWRRYG